MLIAAKADADAVKLAADAESYRLQKINEQITEFYYPIMEMN